MSYGRYPDVTLADARKQELDLSLPGNTPFGE